MTSSKKASAEAADTAAPIKERRESDVAAETDSGQPGRVREHEMKLAVDDDFEMPDLEAVVVGATVGPATERHTEDTYYDTEDFRLLRWGCTVRQRKRKGWTVKLPMARAGAALTRDELNFRGRAGKPTPEVVSVVTAYTRGLPLQPVAWIDNHRTVRTISASTGELLVEVADDRITGRTPDGTISTFRQVEAELDEQADPAVLDAVVEYLLGAGAKPDAKGIKVLKVIGPSLLGPPDVVRPRLGKRPTAKAVLHRAMTKAAIQLIAELPHAMLGEPRGVHQARVATRRMRSDLRTFAPLLDTEVTNRLRQDLKPLAAKLGAIRDTDVLLANFETTIADHPELDEEPSQRVLDLLADQRRQAYDDLGRYVSGDELPQILESLVTVANDPPTTDAAAGRATKELAGLVRKRWRRLQKAVSQLDETPDSTALHEVRLLTKRTRYAAEAVSGAVGGPARRFAKALSKVQDELGEKNDAVVAEAWLVANAEKLDPAAAFAAGRLAQIMGDGSRHGPDSWRAHYGRAARKRNQTWLV